MKIIEQFVEGKHSPETCEDGLIITPHFAAVIDGSTSKTTRHFHPEMKNGRFCMMLIKQTIETMPAETSLQQFCKLVTETVAQQYQKVAVDQDADTKIIPDGQAPSPRERLCASAIIYSTHHRELWMVGDCQAMVDGHLYENGKPYEQQLAGQRALLFAEKVKEHPDMLHDGRIVHDYARDAIIPSLLVAMEGQNKQFAVIDGTPIYSPGIKQISLPNDTKEIVLASDGYPFLCPTLAQSEEALAEQIARDPFNIKTFLATKGLMQGNRSFDDRSYLRLII